LIGCSAGFEFSEKMLMNLASCADSEDDTFERGDAVALHDAEAESGSVEDAEDGDVHLVLLGTADFVDERVGLPVEMALNESDEVKGDEDDEGGEDGWEIETGTAGHSNGGDDPDGGCAGESDDAIAAVEDEAGAEEADSLDDVGGDLAFIGACFPGDDDGEHGEEGGTEADEHVGAEAGGFAAGGAFEADDAA
jgi:hypothetical protein